MAEIQPPEAQINGGALVLPSAAENVGSKRQRRPSVRLGDIGDQPATLSYDAHVRRGKPWNDFKPRKEPNASGKGSKTRPLTNLVSSGGGEFNETLTLEGEDKEGNLDSVAIGSWKVRDLKSKRKRVRSTWGVSKVDEGGEGGDEKFSAGEDVDDGYRDFEAEGSEKEQSPIQSSDRGQENEREVHFFGQRRHIRARTSEGREQDGIELDGPSDTDARDWKSGTNRGRCRYSEDGVRIWLDGLGLGRYAPVFEIHEVDDEVLPMLTLEDLKDMGINAVGSRRKMFCAIQKLGKGFS
ncbi:uncharacterized protein LOC131159646 [Malania oleifera]|uniref:uncharacterized protein LOC131159646 n=1 Tax=Malania oleifera TaxID=397392 RepID=UPI0025ADDA16|nr:uncharacterized protein LOC131159646 [Malania oleifera]